MTITIKRCLIIDDDESFRQLIARYLSLLLPETIVEEYDPVVSGPPPTDFDWTGCDLVILDYFLNSSLTGLDLLNEWKNQENFPPVIMMTAAGSEDVAVRAMKSGVQDYLRKQNITKERLKQAIAEATQTRERERKRQLSSTQSSQSFNKALFYQKLEQPAVSGQRRPVFLLIELDQFDELGEEHGLVMQDNVVRHMAKTTHGAFDTPDYQASMTRIGGAAVGLLFMPRTGEPLEQELAELKSRLSATPYVEDGKQLSFTVSIGAVNLDDSGRKASDVIRCARAVCKQISTAGGNDFAILPKAEQQPRPAGTGKSATSAKTVQPDNARDNGSKRSASPKPTAGSNNEKAVPPAGPAATDATRPAANPANKTIPPSPGKDKIAETRPETSPAPAKPGQPLSERDLLETTLEMPAEKQQVMTADNDNPATETSSDILKAFNDNRIVQYYQPIMPLSETATRLDKEYYAIRIRMVGTNGEIIEASKVMQNLKTSRDQKLLDRWILRQTVGQVISCSQSGQPAPNFIIKLSEASFADATLFNWLQNKLMKSLGRNEPGKSLLIEVTADTYTAKQRQVEALCKFLHQSYGFRFALSSFRDIEQLNTCLEKSRFNMYQIDQKLLAELQSRQSDPAAIPQQMLTMKDRGAMIVSTFIENAADLTLAISCGADFAMGYFIGEPLDNVGIMSHVESFEIT